MQAFHGIQATKNIYLDRLKRHKALDQIIHGTYWEDGKGCAVGCTVHSASHLAYETELGIPQVLARLEDKIFEGVSNGWAQEWPLRFLESIPVGFDLSGVWPKFAVWLLVDPEHGVVKYQKDKNGIVVIRSIAAAYERDAKHDEWTVLRAEARAYTYVAAYAAYAANAATNAAYAATNAANAAANAATNAATNAAYAANAAAYATYAAAYAANAAVFSRQNMYKHQGEKLLELMSQAPVKI